MRHTLHDPLVALLECVSQNAPLALILRGVINFNDRLRKEGVGQALK